MSDGAWPDLDECFHVVIAMSKAGQRSPEAKAPSVLGNKRYHTTYISRYPYL
jgi:hypothetical protein